MAETSWRAVDTRPTSSEWSRLTTNSTEPTVVATSTDAAATEVTRTRM
jgi:hypothetical protein